MRSVGYRALHYDRENTHILSAKTQVYTVTNQQYSRTDRARPRC